MSNTQSIVEVSGYLQTLTSAEYAPKIEKAIQKKDEKSLFEIFRKANIPTKYFSAISATILSVSYQTKYPEIL